METFWSNLNVFLIFLDFKWPYDFILLYLIGNRPKVHEYMWLIPVLNAEERDPSPRKSLNVIRLISPSMKSKATTRLRQGKETILRLQTVRTTVKRELPVNASLQFWFTMSYKLKNCPDQNLNIVFFTIYDYENLEKFHIVFFNSIKK